MRSATKDRIRSREPRENPAQQNPAGRISVPLAWRRRVQRTSSLIESFYHAFRGISVALQGERNLKIHFVVAIVAICSAIFLKFDPFSWALLSLAIGLVITAEMLNTAVERVVDMYCGGVYNSLAKDAKDVAAGAVFCASCTSVAIGTAIYLPRILSFIH